MMTHDWGKPCLITKTPMCQSDRKPVGLVYQGCQSMNMKCNGNDNVCYGFENYDLFDYFAVSLFNTLVGKHFEFKWLNYDIQSGNLIVINVLLHRVHWPQISLLLVSIELQITAGNTPAHMQLPSCLVARSYQFSVNHTTIRSLAGCEVLHLARSAEEEESY